MKKQKENQLIKIDNRKKIILYISLALILFIYILGIVPKSFQNDTLFDISLGKKYVNSGLITQDDFSIHENLEYTPQHFLVNILTYYIHNYFGFFGLYIWCIILTCILSVLLYTANKLFVKNKIVSYMFVFIELFLLIPFISIRAQMYSYIFFLLELIFIEKFLKTKKYLYLILLSLLPLAIINFHAGTIYFYFIIIFVYLLNYINIKTSKIEHHKEYVTNLKYLFIPIIAGVLLMFVNPFGTEQITYCLKTLSNTFINTYIAEFQPLTLTSFVGERFYIYISVIIISLIYTKKKIKLDYSLLLLGTTFMALLTLRHSSLFVIFTIPMLSHVEELLLNIRDRIYKGVIPKGKIVLKYLAIIIFLITCICFSTYYYLTNNRFEYLPKSEYPIESVKYIKENIGNNSKLFNEYTYGSLLMFNDIKVFIDSRCDLYTKEYTKDCDVANDYINIIRCTGNYEELLNKYNIEYLLISKTSSLAKNIFNNSKYQKLFEDKTSFVIKVN